MDVGVGIRRAVGLRFGFGIGTFFFDDIFVIDGV